MTQINKNTNNSKGIGFLGGLTLLFIGLKLFKVISWSWFMVLSPLWMGASFVILMILGALLLAYSLRNK